MTVQELTEREAERLAVLVFGEQRYVRVCWECGGRVAAGWHSKVRAVAAASRHDTMHHGGRHTADVVLDGMHPSVVES